MKISVVVLLVGLGLGVSLICVSEVSAQNYIKLNSELIIRCEKANYFDQTYYAGRECDLANVRSYKNGLWETFVANNESGWWLISTPSGQIKGVCHTGSGPVHSSLLGFQCPDEVASPVRNSGVTTQPNRTETYTTVCGYSNSSSNYYIPNLFGWGLSVSGSNNQGGNGCINQNQRN